jgi:uncharacterized protein (TIGR02271 family)
MENTVVGVYDSYSEAQSAMNELLASGFSRSDIQMNPDQQTTATGETRTHADSDTGHGIGHFFRSLFGMNDTDRTSDIYSEAVRRGSVVLTVNADTDEQRDRAMEIMNRYNPVDIDERSSHWRSEGWSGYDTSAPMLTEDEIRQDRSRYASSGTSTMSQAQDNMMGMQNRDMTTDESLSREATMETPDATMASEDTLARDTAMDMQGRTRTGDETRIPVVQEELKVGKREVQRGGVRVYQRVKETPVHESVQLREEHVNVERHPVDQPATEADLAGIKEGAVEMREMAEEPVVSKDARIVEEVVVNKEVTQETADINDTVRRTEVEVEQLGAAGTSTAPMADTATTTDDSDFRRHWQTAYGSSGGRYEDYDAAYRYGSTLSGSERFKNYRWDDVEPDVRRDWESSHPESTWDKVKDAVRYGAERVKQGVRH